ncbi:BrnA antitoxin family protein [Pandoraea apista]|uniref:BrnA antitoxin family protein n=1 Tax=Pandoraea apista TaxID=93218 RepID=UPI0031EC1A98
MKFELRERGLPFTVAQDVEWDSAVIEEEVLADYGERRYWAFGQIGDRLFALAFVARTEKIHVISLRKANSRAVNAMPKLKPGTVFPTPAEDAKIKKQMRQDSQNPEGTKKDFAKARPANEVLPGIVGEEADEKLLKPRGRPKAEITKERINIRLSPEVVDYFKVSGSGWQTRIDAALRQFIAEHPHWV